MSRTLTYFVADVHLGLDVKDMRAREARFVEFLRSIPPQRTESLYMLGDIWDFWYEYHDVVPKGYVRVFSTLMDLRDAGVRLYFFPGNHDIWCYSYFQSMGIEILQQPYLTQIGGKTFCLGHGDGLGQGMFWYKLMRGVFRNKLFQTIFSFLHPWLAFRIGKSWSKGSRLAKSLSYEFKGEKERLYGYADSFSKTTSVDYFIFGHYHAKADLTLPSGSRLLVLKDWMDASSYCVFDSDTGEMKF